jgi:hypothetical protein
MEKESKVEYMPLLRWLAILTEKGVNVSEDQIRYKKVMGTIDAKSGRSGEIYIAKHEMVARLKELKEKLEPIEAGYYSLYGFLYELSRYGVPMSEGAVGGQMFTGSLTWSKDKHGRYLFPVHELEKRIKDHSKLPDITQEDIHKDIEDKQAPLPAFKFIR